VEVGALFFCLEFAVVFSDERFDIRGACKNSKPLFLVKGDWETPHSIKRNGALLADLEAYPAGALVLELRILSSQSFQLCFQFRFAQPFSPNQSFSSTGSLTTARVKPATSVVEQQRLDPVNVKPSYMGHLFTIQMLTI
jgi:hypothetical protein